MKFLLGEKQNMTQLFDENERVHPVTVVNVGPAVVTQVRTPERDGYGAIQVGFGKKDKKGFSKALLGHFGDKGPFKLVKEFRLPENEKDQNEYVTGDNIKPDMFSPGDKVKVSATSKGKGFQGVVKRHGFAGGPRTHGQKHSEREPGSIGAMGHSRVQKNTKMPGRMGNDRVTTKGLEVVAVDEENNQVYIRGAIPGSKGTPVEIREN